MVCIQSAPTVDLFVFIPAAIVGGGWAWGEHPRFPGVLASDYVYSAREAVALVRSYARAMAPQIRPPEAPRFALLARGRVTRMILARDEWEWSAREHAYTPTGEPWETWRAAARKYFEITGRRIERQRFRASLSPQSRNTVPNVRHKEDVPHEHALPDLYGLNGMPSPRCGCASSVRCGHGI